VTELVEESTTSAGIHQSRVVAGGLGEVYTPGQIPAVLATDAVDDGETLAAVANLPARVHVEKMKRDDQPCQLSAFPGSRRKVHPGRAG